MSQSMKKEWSTTKQGFLLIEIILATSVFVLFMTAFAGVFYYGLQSSYLAGDRARAVMYAGEGQEALRSIKNNGFANLTDGTYGLRYASNTWQLIALPDTNGIFTRQVTITTVDANRKNTSVNVSWQQTPDRVASITLPGRLTNWKTLVNPGVGITVNKIVINHGLTLNPSTFAPYKVGATTVTLASSTIFPPGTYNVTEATDSRYNQTFTGDCNASGQITVASGTSKVCTITNEEKLSYVTINKTVINHGRSMVAQNFAPFKVGSTTVTLGALTPINSGTYQITETTDPFYNLTFTGDCFTNGNITIASGDTKVCTLTNEEILGPGGGSQSLSGLLIYGDGTNVPKFRSYNNTTNTFSAQTPTFTATLGPTWIIRTAPNSHIAIGGYYDSTGTLTIMCFDGTTWTQEFAAGSGGVGNRHRFDIAFEKTSGKAMVIYSKGPFSVGDLGYRTKPGGVGCGANQWTNEVIFNPTRTANDIMYVKLAQDRRAGSNLLALTWVDTADDISARIWDGATWMNEPAAVSDNNMERISSGHDIENMDIEYESLSGDVMLVWSNANGANGTNGVRYRVCTGGTSTCTWGAVTTPPTFLDDASSLDISANPNSDELVFASIGKAGGDLQVGYWNGTGWVNTANADTSCSVPYVGSKLVTTGWVTFATSTRSVVVYSDLNSGNINWYTGNAGVFTRQPDFAPNPAIASPRGYMDIYMDPVDKSQLMYVTSDNSNRLFAKRLNMTGSSTLSWSNSDGGALVSTLPQIISSPFSFAFWQQ